MLKCSNELKMKGDIIMKFAIITDVHGNFDALETVLDDIDNREILIKFIILVTTLELVTRQIKY